MKGDGWLQRYALLVYPDLNMRYVVNKTAPNRIALDAVNDMVEKFANMQPAPCPRALRFEPLAQVAYEDWLTRLNNRNRENKDGESEAIVSAFSKHQTVFPQLALLFQLCADPDADEIGLEQVELAERWCSAWTRASTRGAFIAWSIPVVLVPSLSQTGSNNTRSARPSR